MLQTRNGKRTAMAALKFPMDMVKEKLIDWETAVLRNPADQLEQLLAPVFDLAEVKKAKVIANGLPAGPGAATGKNLSQRRPRRDRRREGRESPACPRRNVAGRSARHDRGGRHPHRSRRGVVRTRRSSPVRWARSASAAPAALQVDYDKKTVSVSGQTFNEGDFLSIDGTAGTVYAGQIKTAPSEIIAGLIDGDKAAQATEKFRNFAQLMKWCAQGHAPAGPDQRRHARADRQRHGVRRRRHRPHPHRAHVLRGRPHRRDARDDPRGQASPSVKTRSRSSCRTSARTSSASSRR